jgi:hypothetical protein
MTAGEELDKVARKNQELDRTLTYSAALKLACLENPRLAAKYIGKDVRLDGVEEAHKHFEKAQQEKRYDMSPVSIIANIITGIPRLANNRIDEDAAVRAANSYPDALIRAATGHMEHLVKTQINIEGYPASEVMRPETMRAIRQRVRRMHPDLANCVDGGRITARGLRDLLPQLFGQGG